MYFKSKGTSLVILGITAIVCSKILFWSFHDPEGANLLIVAMMTLVVYLLSLTTYLLRSTLSGIKRLSLVILSQIVITAVLYFVLV